MRLLLIVKISKVVYPVYLKGLFDLFFNNEKKELVYPLDLSSFNRSGIDPSISSNSTSQAPHHMMRASARENPKSASLSAQQQVSKIQEKLKCVLIFHLNLFVKSHLYLLRYKLSRNLNTDFVLKKNSFEISDLENHRQLYHHHQIAIQVRFEFIRVNIIHLQPSKEQKNLSKSTINPST